MKKISVDSWRDICDLEIRKTINALIDNQKALDTRLTKIEELLLVNVSKVDSVEPSSSPEEGEGGW